MNKKTILALLLFFSFAVTVFCYALHFVDFSKDFNLSKYRTIDTTKTSSISDSVISVKPVTGFNLDSLIKKD